MIKSHQLKMADFEQKFVQNIIFSLKNLKSQHKEGYKMNKIST